MQAEGRSLKNSYLKKVNSYNKKKIRDTRPFLSSTKFNTALWVPSLERAAKLVKHENLLKSLLSLDRSNLTLLSMKWILKFTFKIKNLFNALKRSVVTPNEFRPSFTYLPMAPIICYVITQNAIFLPIFPHTTTVKEMFTFLCCRFSNWVFQLFIPHSKL